MSPFGLAYRISKYYNIFPVLRHTGLSVRDDVKTPFDKKSRSLSVSPVKDRPLGLNLSFTVSESLRSFSSVEGASEG